MTVVICTECGARSAVRSQFEAQCPECGSEDLLEEDAYDDSTLVLRCVDCGREVDAAAPGSRLGRDAGRYTVEDPCPICAAGELVPVAEAPPVGAQPELAMARAAARRVLDGDRPPLPVDVESLAKQRGLTVERGSFGHDGMLVDATIEVPDGNAATQRYVIAHELGHHELRHEVPEDKLEREANAFAAELLMPRAALKAAVESGLTLRQLCARFAVNRQPMIYALQRNRLLNAVRTH